MFDRIDTNYAGTGGATMEDIDVSASANAVMFIGYGDEALGIEGYGRGLFVRDLETGLTEGIAYKLDGSVVTDVNHAFLSDNGRFVVYTSAQDGIVADDHNGMSDVFRYDRSTGTTALISRAYDGSVGNGSTVAGAISGNGAAVAFMTTAANLQEQHRKPIAPLAVVSVVLNDDNSKVSMWRENSWDSYTTILKDEYYIVTNRVLDQQTPIKIYQVIDGGRFGGFASFSYDSVYSFEQTVTFRNPVDGYDPPAPSKQYTVWKNEMAQSHYSSQQQYPEQHMISLNANGTSVLASTLGGGLYYSGDRGQILAAGGGSVSDVQIAENGRYVAFRSGGGVYIWDVDRSKQTGEHVFVPITLDGMTTISAFSLAGNGYSIIVSGKASDGSLVTLRVDNPAFAGGPSDGDWIPDLAVGSPSFRDGGSSSDKMYGTSGDDGLSGHGGADYIYGGAGNDILDGGAGADLISGGTGNDIITGGLDNDTIDGGSDLDEGDIDVVRYSGSIEDHRIVDVPASGDQAAHVRVSSTTNGYDTLYNVEKLQFESARTNVADGSSLYLTMAKAAAAAYGGTITVGGWVALTSLELGLRQVGHNGANGAAYSFANGIFTGNGTNDDGELFAVSATVTFAVVRGVPTLQVAIRGEGASGEMPASLDDAWLALQPLVEALGAYAHDTNADGALVVGGVLITGHGMGGALAQMLMADPAFAGDARVVGATFGSPGAATAVIDDPRLLHFEHASDPIALAVDYVRHDGDLTGAALHQWEEMNGDHAVLALAGDPALAQMVGTGGTVRIGIDGSVMPGFAQHDMAQYLASLTKLAQAGSAFEFMQSGVEGLGGLEVVDVLVGTGGRDVLEGTEPALVNALRGDGYSSADQQFFGGGDNDILYGGSGSDRFVGEAGNDDIDGGANDPDSIDILTLQGSAQDYVFNDVAAANGQPGHSEVLSADIGHDTVRRVEFAEFDMLRTNVVTMDHPMLTMAEAALAVYDDAHVLDGGWAALSALEFGIALDGKIGDSGGFSFADGVYRAQSGSASITAHVYFGVADGKNTLVVALRGGQGQAIDWQNYSDIPLQTALLDPLKIAIGGYLTTGGHTKSSEVDAVMVTGHGVGGALAQTLLQDPAFVHDPRLIGATFGSPGAATGGQDYRVLHVEHAYDPATAIAAFAREERDGDLTNYHAVWKRYFMTETADWVRDPADIEELSTNGGTIRVATDTTVALGQSQHAMETYLATVERLVAMRDTLPFMTDGYWGLPPNGQIDIALGGAGNDTLFGADADLAYIVRGSAEPGNDLLLGGIGQDLLIGGEAKDVFAGTLAELNGDTIGDIVGGEVIRIYGVEIDPLAIRYIPGVDGGILDFGIGRVAIRHAHDGKFDVWDVRSGPGGYTDIGFVGGADVTGDEGDNSLSGGSGDDRLFGGAGNDRLRGGEGADRLSGDGTGSGSAQRSLLAVGGGDDTLDGGAGTDIYTGGAGRDTFVIDGDATDRITDFEAGSGGDRIDVSAFLKAEGWNGSANPFADGTLRLQKRGADLVLVHDADGIEGWQGSRDIAVLEGAAAAMLVPDNFTTGLDPRVAAVARTPVVTTGTGGHDLIERREVAGPHWIDGGNGNDDLRGGTGPDRISGGAGDDLLRGGAGPDEIDGGSDEDTLVLTGFRDDYRIYRLEDGRVAVRDLRTGSPDGWDAVRDVENIRFLGGTMSIDEALDAEPRVTLRGTKQNDGFLMQPQYEDNADLSQGGDDFIYGHPGDNVINFGAALTASDFVNGNGGVDTVAIDGDYSAGLTLGTTTLTDVDVLRMAAGHSYTMTLLDGVAPAEGRIFLVDGSDLGAPDLLRFDGSASQLGAMIVKGGAGNDVIRAGMTGDYITGGRGDDRLDGGGGDDTYRYERIEDMSAAATAYAAAERIAFAGGDRIDMAALDATFIGEGAFTAGVAQIRFRHDGNWTLVEANGATGATVARIAIEGRVYLKEAETGVLVAGEAPPAGGGIILIEGDDRGNVLTGTSGADKIWGRGGNDTINGAEGNDWIDGGTGNDVLTGGTGNDIFFFDNAATSGFDRITDFKSGDLIATTRAISDSNKDGIITFAANGPLRLDNSDKGDRVQIDGLNGKVGLRALGERDGVFYYGLTADRPTPGRKQVVIEGTVGNDVLGGKSASELYFFDNKGPLSTGHDRVTSFGRSDKLLTTTKLAHDAQGRVVANADGLFALGQDSSVALANAGSAVLGLRLDSEFDQNGQHFYSYTAIDL